MAPILGDLIGVLIQTLSIYTLVLLVRVLLTWFPNLDWSNPVLSSVSAITDPYLNIFRGLIPPIGGLDLSAIVAFLALQLVQTLLERLQREPSWHHELQQLGAQRIGSGGGTARMAADLHQLLQQRIHG